MVCYCFTCLCAHHIVSANRSFFFFTSFSLCVCVCKTATCTSDCLTSISCKGVGKVVTFTLKIELQILRMGDFIHLCRKLTVESKSFSAMIFKITVEHFQKKKKDLKSHNIMKMDNICLQNSYVKRNQMFYKNELLYMNAVSE